MDVSAMEFEGNPLIHTVSAWIDKIDSFFLAVAKRRDYFLRCYYQRYLDKTIPYLVQRWIGTLVIGLIFLFKAYQGRYYSISFVFFMVMSEHFCQFLSPKINPDLETMDGASLPICSSDEFKPFIRLVPEFRFWNCITNAICIAFLFTFVPRFDEFPSMGPVLLMVCIGKMCHLTMRQILHMRKYKYGLFNFGKLRYYGKNSDASSSQMPAAV